MLLKSTGSAQKLQVWEDTGRKVATMLWRANGKEKSRRFRPFHSLNLTPTLSLDIQTSTVVRGLCTCKVLFIVMCNDVIAVVCMCNVYQPWV